MATSDRMTGTSDGKDNVISVLYHALQGANTCATSLQDAEHAGDQDLAQFFREVQGTYRQLPTGVRRSCSSDSARRRPVRGVPPDGPRFAGLQPIHDTPQ